MHPDEPAVEEVLVLRVMSEAHRRRVRRALIGGLLLLVAGGGAAVGLTHRSAALPTAAAGRVNASAAGNVANDRAAIRAVVRARYASALSATGPHRTRLEFGRLTVTGTRAQLQVNFVCVPLCGHGEELTLAKSNGEWQVVGARTTWVS
jgi:hypothetical protein